MAVFTTVPRDALACWLPQYDIGSLREFEGIASGIENSNYFVTTDTGRFVLTLFERLSVGELPFYVDLMHHLAGRAIPCPDPIADRKGIVVNRLEGKPAALFTRLAGRAEPNPRPDHCAQVGDVLARMHRAAADYGAHFANPRGLAWCRRSAARLLAFLDPPQSTLLADELEYQRAFAATALFRSLPRSAVHADLFRDNVLFETGEAGEARLCGVIDFWFAGVDTWLFDLAVAVNDWCIDDDDGAFDEPRLDALLGAYRAVRPPLPAESRAWPTMLRTAALRFWLSRLFDRHLPRPAEMVTPKDPAHFERILGLRRAGAPALG